MYSYLPLSSSVLSTHPVYLDGGMNLAFKKCLSNHKHIYFEDLGTYGQEKC